MSAKRQFHFDQTLELSNLVLSNYTRPTIHITGSVGKGSTAAIVYSILRHANPPYSVGRLTSPFLTTVCDDIIIDDKPVSQADFDRVFQQVGAVMEEHNLAVHPTRIMCLTAFLLFEEAKVDLAIVEVLKGGKTDCTNVLPTSSILVSAITSVAMHHQGELGNTVAEIAEEKAGMAREGRPLVLGKQRFAPEVASVIADVVERQGGELVQAIEVGKRLWDTGIDGPKPPKVSLDPAFPADPSPQPVIFTIPPFSSPIHALLSLQGDYQLENLGTALAIISCLLTHPVSTKAIDLNKRLAPDILASGIKNTTWPGRLSFVTIPAETKRVNLEYPLRVLVGGKPEPSVLAALTDLISQALPPGENPISLTMTYLIGLADKKGMVKRLSNILPPTLPSGREIHLDLGVACLPYTVSHFFPFPSFPVGELATLVKDAVSDAAIWTEKSPDASVEDTMIHALQWASHRHQDRREKDGGVARMELIVLFGIYPISDFYRLVCTEM